MIDKIEYIDVYILNMFNWFKPTNHAALDLFGTKV